MSVKKSLISFRSFLSENLPDGPRMLIFSRVNIPFKIVPKGYITVQHRYCMTFFFLDWMIQKMNSKVIPKITLLKQHFDERDWCWSLITPTCSPFSPEYIIWLCSDFCKLFLKFTLNVHFSDALSMIFDQKIINISTWIDLILKQFIQLKWQDLLGPLEAVDLIRLSVSLKIISQVCRLPCKLIKPS